MRSATAASATRHVARNDWRNTTHPVVPGHEIVGEVSAVGPAVSRFQDGDRVAVGCLVDGYMDCRECEMTPIQRINEAFRRMERGDVRYRFVIDMQSLRQPG